jgi:hypothetical protein
MRLFEKVKWFLGIFLVFFLILATNLVDKENFTRIKDSVETTYEDRLVAQDMILDFYEIIQEKEIAIVDSDNQFFEQENRSANESLGNLIERYSSTRLTKEEERVFEEFRANVTGLQEKEGDLKKLLSSEKTTYRSMLDKIKDNLHDLADIQIEEGRRQTLLSRDVMEKVELFSQVEIYILLTLAILVQIIILYNPNTKVE